MISFITILLQYNDAIGIKQPRCQAADVFVGYK